MVMDADAVEACVLAAGDEGGELRQGAPNGHSDIHSDPRHLRKAPSFSRPTIRGLLGNENRAKRFRPATRQSSALRFPCRNRNSRYLSSKKPESAHALGNI